MKDLMLFKFNKKKKYNLFCDGFYYYLKYRCKIIHTSLCFINIYNYILQNNIDIRNVYLSSMSLHDFFNDFACFDDKIKGGGFI